MAATVPGAGRGKAIGIPTINLDPRAAPENLKHGIYACWTWILSERFMGALHFGPRPVFSDPSPTLEVHLLDTVLTELPPVVTLEIVARLRDIENFGSPRELGKAIADDIRATRAILSA